MEAKITRWYILYLLILTPFFKPAGIAYYQEINIFFHLWKLVSLIMVIVLLLLNKTKFSSNQINGMCAFALFCIIYILNSVFRGAEFYDLIVNAVSDMIIMLFVVYSLSTKHEYTFTTSIYNLFRIFVLLEIISIVIVRAGYVIFEPINDDFNYLFGTDNYSAFAIIPMAGTVLYLGSIRNNNRLRISDSILCLLMFVCYSYVKSITAATSMMIFLVFIVFRMNLIKLAKLFSVKKLIFVGLLFLVLILVFDIQNHFLTLIRDILGKGEGASTLNSRTIIWNNSLSVIFEHPLLGVGNLTNEEIQSYILYGAGHTHNFFLELLFRTGIIGTFCYLFFISRPFIHRKKNEVDEKASILIISMTIFFLLSLMDYYPLMPYQYVLFGFLYSLENKEISHTFDRKLIN